MQSALERFKRSGAWNLPVLEDGLYLGVVSKAKIFDAYRKKLQRQKGSLTAKKEEYLESVFIHVWDQKKSFWMSVEKNYPQNDTNKSKLTSSFIINYIQRYRQCV